METEKGRELNVEIIYTHEAADYTSRKIND